MGVKLQTVETIEEIGMELEAVERMDEIIIS